MKYDDLTPVIKVIYWASSRVPGIVADGALWPYTAESFERIERWTHIPPTEARATLETRGEIRSTMWYFRLGFQAHRAGAPPVLTPECGCPVCIAVYDDGGLREGHINCHDYPRSKGEGLCNDPFRVECVCLGTTIAGAPCEACGAYDGSPEAARIVAGLDRADGP